MYSQTCKPISKITASRWKTRSIAFEANAKISLDLFRMLVASWSFMNRISILSKQNWTISVNFGSSSSPKTIKIPIANLVTQEADGSCMTYVGGDGMLFGAPFIRGAYVTYDLDHLEVSLSEAKYTEEVDVVAM